MNDIKGLIEISRYAGMREDLVQAGGGNSSVKLDDTHMLIKASGCQLADLKEGYGYSKVNFRALNERMNEMAERKYTREEITNLEKDILSACLAEGNRPSIETFLHSMPGKYVLHTHALASTLLLCSEDGLQTLRQLFPEAVFVPYRTPGIELALEFYRICREEAKAPEDVRLVFFENHGMLVTAKDPKNCIQRNEEVIEKIENRLSLDFSKYRNITRLYRACKNSIDHFNRIVFLSRHEDVCRYAKESAKKSWEHALSPDAIVYLGNKILRILPGEAPEEKIAAFLLENPSVNVILFEGEAYILADNVKKAKEAESVLAWTAQMNLLRKDDAFRYLKEEEMDFLMNWDSEKYRKNMA